MSPPSDARSTGAPPETAGPPRPVRTARRLGRRLARSLTIGVQAAGRGVVEFFNSENLTFSASIAYYALLSLFPFSLLVLSVLGQLAMSEGGSTLLQLLTRAMPARVEFLAQIEALGPRALQLGVMGTLVMLWAAMGVFGAITSAVNHAWGVEKPRGFWHHKLFTLLMLLTAGVLMVVALVIVGALQVSETGWFNTLSARWPLVGWVEGVVVRNAPMPLFMMVVGLIYYYAPNAEVRLRDVWVGALLAGLLWRGAFALFTWYLRDLSRFNVDGSVATVIAFLTWVYFSAAILLYGAEVSAAYARLRKQIPQTEPAAPEREPVA
ncbi:MAG: YihY/virulence factor BrkB family protein [Acidobacteria bacterium]|nr:YihY/virulence factor BrkB family protein [Acidobacteriota bacterium]